MAGNRRFHIVIKGRNRNKKMEQKPEQKTETENRNKMNGLAEGKNEQIDGIL